jgi:hypothetical protein
MKQPNASTGLSEQQQFLALMKEGLPQGSYFQVAQRVVTASGREVYPAEPWREQHLDGPWYFSTGASSDRKHRRAKDFVAVRAIILDDIGTKIDPDKITVEPTWRLETSKDNYQWGYLLKTWDTDIEKADGLMQALVGGGYQDKGVNRACRLFRIPGSLNTKKDRDNFVADLITIDGARTFTLNSIAKAFNLKFAPIEKKEGDAAPINLEDPIFKWLQERGMVRHELTEGWWEIDCPWAGEHSSTDRTEAKYRPSANPGAMCHHGHGEDGTAFRQRFFAWVEEEGGPKLGATRSAVTDMFKALGERPVDPAFGLPPPQRAEGEEYTFGTLRTAIGLLPNDVLPDRDVTQEGHLKKIQPCTIDNIEAGLKHLGIQPRFNLMQASTSYVLPDRVDMSGFGSKTRYEIDEMVRWAIRSIFNRAGISNEQKVDAAIAGLASSVYWHPAKDWIESKPWDGQDRLQHLLGSVKTANPDLFKTYFRRWALQTIEAACGWAVSAERREQQKSLCLVLAGKQGIGKSRWLASLAPGYFVGGRHLSLDSSVSGSRDSVHQVLQGMIVELGELDTTFTKSANGSLKAFLSQAVDVYRQPYAETPVRRPRCASFCATVNDDQFLQDDTGSRRYAVVWADWCHADHTTDMQQFWAQMHSYWAAGEQWWLTPGEEKLQADSNERFQAADGIVDMVQMEIEKREARDTYTQECSLNATGVLMVIQQRAEDRALRRRAKAACIKLIGPPADYRKRDGTAESWVFWLTATEAKSLGVKRLRPSKV